jgi:hypothetical protein
MRMLTLTCNQCGAALEVPEDILFVTCTTCCSQLVVHRSGNTAYTQGVEASATDNLERQLETLDREWTKERERYATAGRLKLIRHGMRSAMALGLVLVGYGTAVDTAHLGRSSPGPVPYVCMILGTLLVLGWAAFFLLTGSHRSRIAEYDGAVQSYTFRRHKILQDIERRKGTPPDA